MSIRNQILLGVFTLVVGTLAAYGFATGSIPHIYIDVRIDSK